MPAFLNEAAPFGCVRDTCSDTVLAKLTNRPITLPKTDKVRHMFYDTCSDTVLAKLTNRPITQPKTDTVTPVL